MTLNIEDRLMYCTFGNIITITTSGSASSSRVMFVLLAMKME